MEKYRELLKITGKELDTEYMMLKNSNNIWQLNNFIKKNDIKEIYEVDYMIYLLIFNQTLLNKSQTVVNSLYSYIRSNKDYVKNMYFRENKKWNTTEFVIDTTKGEVRTMILSDTMPELLNYFKELMTIERANTCFSNSRNLSMVLGFDNDVVTGIVHGITDKSEYLHSWIESKINGEDVVIDFTMNVVINKEGYYRFRHAKEIERINTDTLKDDYKKYGDAITMIDAHSAFYNLFRDEYIKDLQKNDEITRNIK